MDAGLVIADAMMPEPMRPGWPEGLRHRMLRLPCEPLLAQDERFAAALGIRTAHPLPMLLGEPPGTHPASVQHAFGPGAQWWPYEALCTQTDLLIEPPQILMLVDGYWNGWLPDNEVTLD